MRPITPFTTKTTSETPDPPLPSLQNWLTVCRSYSSKKVQALRYFADRLGSLMSASLPWVFLFGSRSNPLVYMTGWSYATFSFFHRWVAIVLAVEGVLHGAVFCAFYVCGKEADRLATWCGC